MYLDREYLYYPGCCAIISDCFTLYRFSESWETQTKDISRTRLGHDCIRAGSIASCPFCILTSSLPSCRSEPLAAFHPQFSRPLCLMMTNLVACYQIGQLSVAIPPRIALLCLSLEAALLPRVLAFWLASCDFARNEWHVLIGGRLHRPCNQPTPRPPPW